MDQIYFIDEGNKGRLDKPSESNVIYYSELKEWQSNNSFRSFSIKAVSSGSIHYRTEDNNYNVRQGNYLIAPKQDDVSVFFDSHTFVKSLCIDIASRTVEEAVHSFSGDDRYNLELYRDAELTYPYFFENIYTFESSVIGQFLNQLFQLVDKCKNDGSQELFKPDWFLTLADTLVSHQLAMGKCLMRIQKQKTSTRKEILRRILLGKKFIDENYLQNPAIGQVAEASNMSEFHFYRNFKKAFDITPHDYLTNLRLDFARRLLESQHYSPSEVSKMCAFPDIATFSHAFKRKYLMAPSHFQKQLGNLNLS